MAVDRQTVREALATEATTYVTSAKAIYDYLPDTISHEWPVLAFETTGSERVRNKFTGPLSGLFHFNAYLIVLYADKEAGWTRANAEDALDAMEHEFATFVESEVKTANWINLAIDGRSVVTPPIDIYGKRFIFERIPLAVRIG